MAKSGRELARDLRSVREVLRGNMLYNPLTGDYVRITTSPGDDSLETSSVEGRLRYAKRLHELGLIDDIVYRDVQQEIVAGL